LTVSRSCRSKRSNMASSGPTSPGFPNEFEIRVALLSFLGKGNRAARAPVESRSGRLTSSRRRGRATPCPHGSEPSAPTIDLIEAPRESYSMPSWKRIQRSEGVLFDLPNIVPHAVAAVEATRVAEAFFDYRRRLL
jgi:hypothetical protein